MTNTHDERERFLREAIEQHLPEDIRARALENLGLMAMQASRDSTQTLQERSVPAQFRKGRAKAALDLVRARVGRMGSGLIMPGDEELVRAVWTLVASLVDDRVEYLQEVYRNSGLYEAPDMDEAQLIQGLTEVPLDLLPYLR